MQLINLLEIRTHRGLRHFKLMHGDICEIDFPVDILCVSAFKGSYAPIQGTVLGALYQKKQIDLNLLSKDPEIDLRHSEHSFITHEVNDRQIGRILCLEMIGTNHKDLEQNLNSLLFTLYKAEISGMRINNIIMPLLGTGNQSIDPDKVMHILLKKIEYLLLTSNNIDDVMLVAFSKEQAGILNNCMNTILGRKSSLFQADKIMSGVIESIRDLFNKNRIILSNKAFTDLLQEIGKPEIDATKFAIISRAMCEHILARLIPGIMKRELSTMIHLLKERNVQPWLESYFHLIRVFGNAHVHDELRKNIPAEIDESDMVIVLFGLERVLRYYVDEQKKTHPKKKN
jgi:hypothetical protein